jgi:hypothetical protein
LCWLYDAAYLSDHLETDMQRFAPTRSLATGVLSVALAFLLALIATMPLTHVHPMIVAYVAMIVAGTGMLLRERVFVPASNR